MARANVKPLTHWVIYKSYTVRFGSRTPTLVTGTLITPDGPVPFAYEPQTMVIHLNIDSNSSNRDSSSPDSDKNSSDDDGKESIQINEYGWEVD